MVADRLNKLRTDIEDTYQAINEIGGTIPSDKNTNNIPEAIRSVYDNLPKVSDTGTNVSLSPTLKGRLGIVPKGNTYQESTTGKNLAEFGTTKDTSKYTYNSYLADNIDVEKTTTGGSFYASYILHIPSAGTYKFKGNVLYGNQAFYIYSDTLWGTQVKNGSFSEGEIVYSTTFDEAGDYVLGLYGSALRNYGVKDFMVMSSSTTDDTYEPYTGGQPSPSPDFPMDIQSATGTQKVVVSGKNLFDKISATNGQQNYVLNNDGTITNSNNWGANGRTYLNPISLNAGTYTLSYIPNLNGTRTQIRFSLVDGNTSTDITNNAITITNNIKQNYTFTLSDTTNLKICIMPNGSSDGTLTLSDIQLKNQEPQEVDIELSSIELNKIGDYEDYIGGTPDNWVLYKNVEKTVITESNKNIITSFGTQNEHNRILINKTDLGWKTSWNSGVALLNKYKEITSASSVNTGKFATTFTQGALTIWNDSFTNLATAQSLLIGTEILITKAETQQTPITDTNLVSQLNELYYLQSYNDTTNIDVTGNLPMRITTSAIKGE